MTTEEKAAKYDRIMERSRTATRKYRMANRDKVNQLVRNWLIRHPEYQNEYYQKNKEKIKARMRANYLRKKQEKANGNV